MKRDEVKTRLIFENNENRFIWESPYDDVTMEDILNALYGLCVSATWCPDTVIKSMKDFAEERAMYVEGDKEYEADEDTKPHFYA